MIIFNGVDLEDIAPVKFDDILVSPMNVQPVTRQNVGIGEKFVRMTGGTRTITIKFALLEQDRQERFNFLEAIKELAKPCKE